MSKENNNCNEQKETVAEAVIISAIFERERVFFVVALTFSDLRVGVAVVESNGRDEVSMRMPETINAIPHIFFSSGFVQRTWFL